MSRISPKIQSDKGKKTRSTWEEVGFLGEIGYGVAIPALAGTLAGKWLDGQLGTERVFTVSGIGFGLLLAIISVSWSVKRYISHK